MTIQGSLFSSPQAREPPLPQKQPRFRLPLEQRVVKHPSGKPDGKGKYFYQKMHMVLDELPEQMRERFNDLTYGANFQHVELFAKALRMYCSASPTGHLDFDVSRGMLRESE